MPEYLLMETTSCPLSPPKPVNHTLDLFCNKARVILLNKVAATLRNYHAVTFILVCDLGEALIVPRPVSIIC
jgi:hypothetical protein